MADDATIKYNPGPLVAKLDKIAMNVAAMRGGDKYARAISPIIFKDIIEHFQEEKGPKGKWKPWSKSYSDAVKAGRARKPGKILQDTGTLRQSFRPLNYRKKSVGFEWYNPARTKKGFPYAFAHDTGGPVLPQRQFMWLSNKAMSRISKISFAFILGNKKA